MNTRTMSCLLGLALGTLAALPAHAADPRACTTCHGLDGMRQAPGAAPIGGRDYYELLAAMASFRNGERFHPIMSTLMQAMDEADMAEVAEYFAGKGQPEQLGAYAAP